MISKRLFVERRPGFDIESQKMKEQVNLLFNIDLINLRYFIVYDLFDIEEDAYSIAIRDVFSEPNKDYVSEEITLSRTFIAIEYLPGQFDQRADSAIQCIKLFDPSSKVTVTSSYLFMFDNLLSENDLSKLKDFTINKVESREKNLMLFEQPIHNVARPVSILNGFINFNQIELEQFYQNHQAAMSLEDMKFIQKYFQEEEHRDPYETELKVLDTYWSDHCRHTTFITELSKITFEPGTISAMIEKSFQDYLKTRVFLGITKPMSLMDLATINKNLELHNGNLNDLEISEEINACSIYIDVVVDNTIEKWLLMFKNETHNHPTEIEPFGGASTCIGGAIRDPLSGRSYVYGALRITGAGDINRPISETLKGKLPQRIISKTAALGYSSYGNQIGIATTYVNEIFHDGFIAKRMEVGAVIGAVKASDIIREKPMPGDLVVVIGGRTGRDGIGGATGSSKTHSEASLTEASSEVQKGNAPEERKIQRLFRNVEVTKMIKKSNDFGAGGVSVAIGELAQGVLIDLDQLPVKYLGINGTELAISESQERMAVVIDPKNESLFLELCHEENIEAVTVAKITDQKRLAMTWQGKTICDISRDFLETSGVRQKAEVIVTEPQMVNPFKRDYPGEHLKQKIMNMLQDNNISSLQGLSEMFDSSIGRTTVLSPFGGIYQKTKTYASVQRIPVKNNQTETVSIMAYGYDPNLSSWSPYHGGAYAVVDSIARIVSSGGSYQKIRFSFQEYFERLEKDPKRWQKPFTALLGAYQVQKEFNLPAIGGKDSMSGSFMDYHVPPTLISFAVTTDSIHHIISPEFKSARNFIYLVECRRLENDFPDIQGLKSNFDFIKKNIENKVIVSCSPLEFGGLGEAVIKATFGNRIGVRITTDYPMFDLSYGSLIIESTTELSHENVRYLGKTISEPMIIINNTILCIEEFLKRNETTFHEIYPIVADNQESFLIEKSNIESKTFKTKQVSEVTVLIPVFPGTNCETDSEAAFALEGAKVKTFVFRNLTQSDIEKSIDDFALLLNDVDILMLSGGFSSGDEPDGSGKYIASVLKNRKVASSIQDFLKRKKLILGICNGFQALVKSGLLPYGTVRPMDETSPTLFKNDIYRHVSKFTKTKVSSRNSPWLHDFKLGEIHSIPMSHGEGKFIVSEEEYRLLADHGQIAFQYVDQFGEVTTNPEYNINGSTFGIEGILSEDGLILGKMGHPERIDEGLFKNITGNKNQHLFRNAIKYFKNGGTR